MRGLALVLAVALAGGAPSPSFTVHTVAQQDPWLKAEDAAPASVSADGRFVAFTSCARLVPADANDRRDIYVLDRVTGQVTLESVPPEGYAASGESVHPRLSADGRFLVYQSDLPGVAGRPQSDIVLRDRAAGTLRVVSRGAAGMPANGASMAPAISADGRHVVFASHATNLIAGTDLNGSAPDIYGFDARGETLARISLDDAGVQRRSGESVSPSVSGDGRFVAFASTAPLDEAASVEARRPVSAVYVRDRQRGTTVRVTARSAGARAGGASWRPVLSADGRLVAFVSDDPQLIANDRNRLPDVLLVDLRSGAVTLVSRSAGGGAANGRSGNPAISADGRSVAFQSEASDLLCSTNCAAPLEDINLLWDVFVFDVRTAAVSRASGGTAGGWIEPSIAPALDGGGALVVFSSRHPTDAADLRNDFDLFLRATTTEQMAK